MSSCSVPQYATSASPSKEVVMLWSRSASVIRTWTIMFTTSAVDGALLARMVGGTVMPARLRFFTAFRMTDSELPVARCSGKRQMDGPSPLQIACACGRSTIGAAPRPEPAVSAMTVITTNELAPIWSPNRRALSPLERRATAMTSRLHPASRLNAVAMTGARMSSAVSTEQQSAITRPARYRSGK
ncbi:hypothetical protein DEJ17_15940 [Curtobacterium sp. MCSS17_011]|nr:hypothetical protein DEJ17_15940 [Curtobacterium sp. MCSS17_011]